MLSSRKGSKQFDSMLLNGGRENDFEDLQKIGVGGFSSVYKGRNKLDKKIYALKKIKLGTQYDPDQKTRLRKVEEEVTRLSSLHHKSIVRYYTCWISQLSPGDQKEEKTLLPSPREELEGSSTCDLVEEEWTVGEYDDDAYDEFKGSKCSSDDDIIFGELEIKDLTIIAASSFKNNPKKYKPESYFYIQMELCDQTLQQYLQTRNRQIKNRGKMNKRDTMTAFRLSIQLIESLIYLKENQIIHRDIKPSNIFINNCDSLKIGDFGLVKHIDKLVLHPSPFHSPVSTAATKGSKFNTNNTIFQLDSNCSIHFNKTAHRKLTYDETTLNFTLDSDDDFFIEEDIQQRVTRTKSMFINLEEFTSNVGTKLYASPEQTNSKFYSFGTDHFSAALVILEILYPMYTEMQRIQILRKAREEDSLPIQFELQFRNFHSTLSKMLSRNPEDRADLQDVLVSLRREEIEFKKSNSPHSVLFRREDEKISYRRQVVIHEHNLFIYKNLEDLKAEYVFNLLQFRAKSKVEEVALENEFIQGCVLSSLDNREKFTELWHSLENY